MPLIRKRFFLQLLQLLRHQEHIPGRNSPGNIELWAGSPGRFLTVTDIWTIKAWTCRMWKLKHTPCCHCDPAFVHLFMFPPSPWWSHLPPDVWLQAGERLVDASIGLADAFARKTSQTELGCRCWQSAPRLLSVHVFSAGSVLVMRKQIPEVGQRIVAWGASGQRWCRSLWHTSHQRVKWDAS